MAVSYPTKSYLMLLPADFAINYLIHNANVAQMFHGDYAQYFKGDFKSEKDEEGFIIYLIRILN